MLCKTINKRLILIIVTVNFFNHWCDLIFYLKAKVLTHRNGSNAEFHFELHICSCHILCPIAAKPSLTFAWFALMQSRDDYHFIDLNVFVILLGQKYKCKLVTSYPVKHIIVGSLIIFHAKFSGNLTRIHMHFYKKFRMDDFVRQFSDWIIS